MANMCLIFKTYWNSDVAYIKSFPIKRIVSISGAKTTMLRAQTTTNHTTGIPTRPCALYLMLVPRTPCYKWTKPDTLQFKSKNDHSMATHLAANYTLFICFSDWTCATCDVIFMDWVTNYRVFFFGSGYRFAGGDMGRTKCWVCNISSTVMVLM